MNLQDLIDKTDEYGTLHLEFDEYIGQVVIKKPIVIDGNNSTVCALKGPVIRIHSEGVVLRNLRVEVTSVFAEEHESAVALSVENNIRVKMQHVTVKGDVSGVVNEDGKWDYPDILHLWPVVPKQKNYFVFEMNVPVSCALETDITGVEIENPGLRPGVNTVHLTIDNLKEDTILFGEIEIKSTYLRRIISISGGSFGVKEDYPKPEASQPVNLGKTTKSAQPVQLTSIIPEKMEKRGNSLFLIGIAFLFIFAGIGISTFFLTKDKSETDINKPSGVISGINENYSIGDRISYTIHANDDNGLKLISFFVKDLSISQSVAVSGTSATYASDFSTQGFNPGIYVFSFTIEDRSGNIYENTGYFNLIKPSPAQPEIKDTEKPVARIFNIKNSYVKGDIVAFTIEAEDNLSLRDISFELKDFSEKWSVEGRSASKSYSFLIDNWTPGTYQYTYTVSDKADNYSKYVGNLILTDIQYGYVNINTKPWMNVYIEGKFIQATPIAKLKLKAGSVSVRFVNESKKIDETKKILVEPNKTTIYSFEWK